MNEIRDKIIMAGAISLLAIGTVQAAIITGVTVHDYSTQHADFPATLSVNATTDPNVDAGGLFYQGVDGNGDDVWHHDNSAANMYLSLLGNATAWLEFDLGTVTNLTEIHLWNYNLDGQDNGTVDKTKRGVKTFDVYVSTDGGTGNNQSIDGSWTMITTSALTLDEATGGANYAGQRFDLADTAARYVRIDMTLNHGSAFDIIGLSEAHFYTIPESGSFALIAGCLGLVSVMLRRRR